MTNEQKERECTLLDVLKTIGETLFKKVVFFLEENEKLGNLPLRACIMEEEATLHNKAVSLINEVKEIYPESYLELIKTEIIKAIESEEKRAKNI